MFKYFQKSLSQLSDLPKKSQLAIIIILASCFCLALGVTVSSKKLFFKQAEKKLEKSIPPTDIPKPALVSLKSNSDNIANGEVFSLSVEIFSPNQAVEASDFIISFDPKYLKPQMINEGNFFPTYPVKTISDGFVKISGAASYSENKITIPKGRGTVADITFVALQPTIATSISLDKEKTIIASAGKNILDQNTKTSVSIEIQ